MKEYILKQIFGGKCKLLRLKLFYIRTSIATFVTFIRLSPTEYNQKIVGQLMTIRFFSTHRNMLRFAAYYDG